MRVVMILLVMMVLGRDGLVMRMAQVGALVLIVVAAVALAELVAVQLLLRRVIDGAMSGRRRRHVLEAFVDEVNERQRRVEVAARRVQRADRTAAIGHGGAERQVTLCGW